MKLSENAEQLIELYGSPMNIAIKLIQNKIPYDLQNNVKEVVDTFILQAAKEHLYVEMAKKHFIDSQKIVADSIKESNDTGG